MKINYEKPTMKIITFNTRDIIQTSGGGLNVGNGDLTEGGGMGSWDEPVSTSSLDFFGI